MPISKPHSTLGADNKGSCTNLVLYLDKENQDIDILIGKRSTIEEFAQLQGRKQQFFNHNRMDVSCIEVIDTIDNNKKKLGKKDAKYFAPTISFSQTELAHISFKATGRNDINSIWEMNLDELNNYNALIREYIRMIMDNYAENFNRKEKGLNSGADLVYFGKIEHFRKYKGTDKEVLSGKVKTGKLKSGLQTHAHLIVSRKDKTQRLKLSPMSNEKSTTRTIGNNKYHVGFDRVKWIQMNEKRFDSFFNYARPKLEKFKNQNILKNGSPKEKEQLNLELNTFQQRDQSQAKEDENKSETLNLTSATLNNLMVNNNSNFDDFEENTKKRKKRKKYNKNLRL